MIGKEYLNIGLSIEIQTGSADYRGTSRAETTTAPRWAQCLLETFIRICNIGGDRIRNRRAAGVVAVKVARARPVENLGGE